MAAHILIADDDDDVAHVVMEVVQHWGFSTTRVTSGREAYALLASCNDLYSMAIIDVKMPNGDGVSCIKLIRELGIVLPVLFITGQSDELLSEMREPVLQKPFHINELMDQIKSIALIK